MKKKLIALSWIIPLTRESFRGIISYEGIPIKSAPVDILWISILRQIENNPWQATRCPVEYYVWDGN